MQSQAFLSESQTAPDTIGVEISLKLYSYPKPDREPVKILVIGSREAVSVIVNSLHQLRFAETLEWTDFLPAPTGGNPLQFREGEVMKALVKYLPRT
jgi:hypothetical protein